jgi:hypothetical protein
MCPACLLGGSPRARRAAAERDALPAQGRIQVKPLGGIACSAPRVARQRGATPESLVLHAVEAALRKIPGVLIWRNSVGMTRTANGGFLQYGLGKGSADLIGILGPAGRFLAIEVKAEAGVIAPHQTAWLDRVRELGGVAAVVRSAAEAVEVVMVAQRGRA